MRLIRTFRSISFHMHESLKHCVHLWKEVRERLRKLLPYLPLLVIWAICNILFMVIQVGF